MLKKSSITQLYIKYVALLIAFYRKEKLNDILKVSLS